MLGTPPYNYLSYSFRKGATAAAAKAGILEDECKILGWWKGLVVKRYFRNHPNTMLML